MPDIILASFVVFVAFALILSCILLGVVLVAASHHRALGKRLEDAYTSMETFAKVNNDNVQAMSQAITDLQEKVQAHDIRLAGGVVKAGPFQRQ